MKDLYSASETRKKLGGISGEQLKRLVEDGKIRKVTPPTNKKRGYYAKEDVDKLAEAVEDFIEIYAATPQSSGKIEFVQAKGKDDIKETVQIARQHLGDNAYGLERRMPWFELSPKGDYVLKHDNIVVGYFSMQAIKPESIEDVFDQQSGRSIQLEDMEPIEPGRPLQVHISGIGVKMGISRKQARQYGESLLLGILSMFVELGRQGIEISKIWAKSSTVPGIKLSRDLGLTEIGYINNEQIGFVLDLGASETNKRLIKKYLLMYREALGAKQLTAQADSTVDEENKQQQATNSDKHRQKRKEKTLAKPVEKE